MEFALAPLTLHRPHQLAVVEAAAGAGYDLTGMQFALYGQPLSPLATDPDFLVAARTALAQGGISVLEVSNVVFEEGFEIATAEALVRFAAAIGARFVQAVSWDDNRARAVEHLARTAELAAEEGLHVAFEFMPYSAVRDLPDARSMLEETGSANIGLLLDSLHFFRSNSRIEDLADLDPSLLAVLQLSDAPSVRPPDELLRPESTGNRLIPGTGGLPLRELVAALPGGLPVSLEVPCKSLADEPAVEQARAVLEGTRRFFEER